MLNVYLDYHIGFWRVLKLNFLADSDLYAMNFLFLITLSYLYLFSTWNLSFPTRLPPTFISVCDQWTNERTNKQISKAASWAWVGGYLLECEPTYQWLYHWRKWHLPHVTVNRRQEGRFLSPSLFPDEMLLGPILYRSCQMTIAALGSWMQEPWDNGGLGDDVLQHFPALAFFLTPHLRCSLSLRAGL